MAEQETVTGYDCEFVDPVCEDIQTICSICLLILREPYMVQCCGNRFCRACLERIQPGGIRRGAAPDIINKVTPCPLCKQNITAAMPDKQLERLLNEKRVSCSNKWLGCTWSGELVKFEGDHLNENPQAPDRLMEGCLYVQVLCSQCQRVKVERQKMTSHMKEVCPRRVAKCAYCKTHRAAYEDISRIHHLSCQQIPVPCPKGCGAKPLRKNVETHVANWCPKNPQPCPFHVVGCTKKLAGQQMERHLSDWVVYEGHLSNMEKTVASLRKDIRKKDSQIMTLQENLNEKDAQVRDLLSAVECKDRIIGTLRNELAACETQRNRLEVEATGNEQEVKDLREELDSLKKEYTQKMKKKIDFLLGEITKRDKQIEKLKKKNAEEEQVARQLKNENAELRKCMGPLRRENTELHLRIDPLKKENVDLRKLIDRHKREKCELKKHADSLEARIRSMKAGVEELNEVDNKSAHADSLKRQVKELQQVVQSQKGEVRRLTNLGDQKQETLKSKVTELQLVIRSQKEEAKRLTELAEQGRREQDSLEDTVTELKKVIQTQQAKIDQRSKSTSVKEESTQTVSDPPADGRTPLGAAAGVALAAGIVAAAAVARNLKL